MERPQFSPDLQRELAAALTEFASLPAGTANTMARLRDATNRVCTEAHQQGMSPEGMVIALRQLYDAIPVNSAFEQERRPAAYDRPLSSCIHAYFKAAPKPTR